jgi:hypothetical protein
VLRIAVWVLPVVWLSGHLRYSFIAASQARLDYRAAWIGALTVLALTIAFVPALRSRGAALGLLGGAMANGVAALVQARTALPALELPPGVWRAGLACLACLGLGAILTPAAGELGATLASVLLFATLALVVERPRWPSLHAHADN